MAKEDLGKPDHQLIQGRAKHKLQVPDLQTQSATHWNQLNIQSLDRLTN